MSNLLNSKTFGSKIYNKFPMSYRDDDALVNLSLKRYIEALSEGGFKYAIDEINGITHIIDPSKTQSEVLPVLFEQFGLEVFNGIPENYLRYLLPRLGEAWSKKGSLSVLEFITSSLTGIKNSTKVEYDEDENPKVIVRLEMDYNTSDYFPESSQFSRLLENFVPFYCDLGLVYSYLFSDITKISGGKESELLNITDVKTEEYSVNISDSENNTIRDCMSEEPISLTGSDTKIEVIKNNFYADLLATKVSEVVSANNVSTFIEEPISMPTSDEVISSKVKNKVFKDDASLSSPSRVDSVINRKSSTLNGAFYTNAVYSYNIIHKSDGSTEIRY